MYLMQGISLLIAIPAIYYTRKTVKYKSSLTYRTPGFNYEHYEKLNRKMIFYLSFGSALVITSEIYAYKSDFEGLYKLLNNK